jgi:arsenate reductase (thioredoxin)
MSLHDAATASKPKVIFVCIENSNRSQMAEAFARMLGGDKVEVYSSGSRPSGKVNPKAIAAMAELGYDLGVHASKPLDQVPQKGYAAVITMGCGDECPFILGDIREDWGLPDPKTLPPEEFNQVRDAIRDKVKDLLGRIGVAAK